MRGSSSAVLSCVLPVLAVVTQTYSRSATQSGIPLCLAIVSGDGLLLQHFPPENEISNKIPFQVSNIGAGGLPQDHTAGSGPC